MSDGSRFEIGTAVACGDGDCGELLRLVVDPETNAVTHLAVGPPKDDGAGRLVPVDLVAFADRKIRLSCSRSEFEALLHAQDAELLPQATQPFGTQGTQVLSADEFVVFPVAGGNPNLFANPGQAPRARIFDRVPEGEVEVRPGDAVEATDGPIGRVAGLIVDPADHHVTHVLLDEGHLWGKKQVAIPIGDVKRIGAAVQVNLTKKQVGDLPSVDAPPAG
jgi:sporulation protein YlmC with PRC-barrel domain